MSTRVQLYDCIQSCAKLTLCITIVPSSGHTWSCAEDAGRDRPAVRLALDPVLCIWRATNAAYTPLASIRSPCWPCSTSLPLLITHMLSACTCAHSDHCFGAYQLTPGRTFAICLHVAMNSVLVMVACMHMDDRSVWQQHSPQWTTDAQ